jgi:hypothetical protein
MCGSMSYRLYGYGYTVCNVPRCHSVMHQLDHHQKSQTHFHTVFRKRRTFKAETAIFLNIGRCPTVRIGIYKAPFIWHF